MGAYRWLVAGTAVMLCCTDGWLSGDGSARGRGNKVATALLYPRPSETREVASLDGVWNFRLAPSENSQLGHDRQWYLQDLHKTGDVMDMPVPASYNDIAMEASVRDHVGLVWYDRRFYISDAWSRDNRRVILRFSSVHYSTEVWLNGKLVLVHEIGHLPFEADVTEHIKWGGSNLLTVAVDNMLLEDSVPQGALHNVTSDLGYVITQSYTFDFFNYAGIHRPVTLYSLPNVHIKDITVNTDIEGDTGVVNYKVLLDGVTNDTSVVCEVRLCDREQTEVASDEEVTVDYEVPQVNGSLKVPLARLWWPWTMNPDPGYLYSLEVRLYDTEQTPRSLVDSYYLPVGIRTLHWDNDTFTINGRQVYLSGFGRHEDSDIRGKGLDLALSVKDHNLIRWVGANAYRTSHYPYSDELMDMADKHGVMIIDECPSVDTEISTCNDSEGLNYFQCVMESDPLNILLGSVFKGSLLKKHKQSLTELIARDKNHPSVIAWSVANEPRSQLAAADDYFGAVVQHVKSLDTSRPVTAALSRGSYEDRAGKHMDIISFNRYNGWYSNPGRLDMITSKVVLEAQAWRKKYNKPILMSEYGADTYEGLHIYPEYVWSEDYQVSLMSQHFKAFDTLRAQGWFIGEFIWNFADFKTAQTTTRAGGNKKGIFTRNRQPKASAHHLRKRYWQLANQLYNTPLPEDLRPYEIDTINNTECTYAYEF